MPTMATQLSRCLEQHMEVRLHAGSLQQTMPHACMEGRKWALSYSPQSEFQKTKYSDICYIRWLQGYARPQLPEPTTAAVARPHGQISS